MCATCGCSDHSQPPAVDPHRRHDHERVRPRDHDQAHRDHPDVPPHAHDAHAGSHGDVGAAAGRHDAPAAAARADLRRLERDVLARNDLLAAENRGWLTGRAVLALNVVSSPGAGKTTLLERTIRELGGGVEIRVVEGDQDTARDAERIRAAGARAHQITTGTVCHLDAAMIRDALPVIDPPPGSLLVIENVGNLVCPALFDLGERAKVVVASVPEGDDKPLKYPHMFRAGAVVVLNKIDLLPYVPFDLARFVAHARQVNARLEVFPVSALRGDGLERWYDWIRARLIDLRGSATRSPIG